MIIDNKEFILSTLVILFIIFTCLLLGATNIFEFYIPDYPYNMAISFNIILIIAHITRLHLAR